MNPNVRQPDETFEEYKVRRRIQRRVEHAYLSGVGRDLRLTSRYEPTYTDVKRVIKKAMFKQRMCKIIFHVLMSIRGALAAVKRAFKWAITCWGR
jgi:hypothetical protein